MIGSKRKRLLIALAFLLPNLIGFLLFTAGPVFFSLYMSFTDWALTKHNNFSENSVNFVGLDNYTRLLYGSESEFFWDYFWNTVFLMIGIPLSIFGSLGLALLVNAKATPVTNKNRWTLGTIAAAITLVTCLATWVINAPPEALKAVTSTETGLTDLSQFEVEDLRRKGLVLFIAVVGIVITAGLTIGQTFFRAAFYLPTLLSGVAMFLLWKTLYRPRGGLINAVLDPILNTLEGVVSVTPAWMWYAIGITLTAATALLVLRSTIAGIQKLRFGESGPAGFLGRITLLATVGAVAAGISYVAVQLPEKSLFVSGYAPLTAEQLDETLDEFETQLAGEYEPLELQLVRNNLAPGAEHREVLSQLISVAGDDNRAAVTTIVNNAAEPVRQGYTSGDGLTPPEWLISSDWAKTALIVMGVWMAIGGANMLLYLAGLSNVPPELYEAAAIDGATGWQRFIHVTWPQLAPTTFFIVVMSTIGGLQGGFEQALVMTEGKADTIVLTYYLYNLAFNGNFELGLASAVAWIMFAMIFAMTAINFRLGSRMTNE